MPKFKSRNPEGGVVISSPGVAPINVLRGEAYETEDKAQVAVLRGSPEVEEVKGKAAKDEDADENDEETETVVHPAEQTRGRGRGRAPKA